MSGPTFKPNDTVWHVRHGKVTLVANTDAPYPDYTVTYPLTTEWGNDGFTYDGKHEPSDAGRVLFTLAEAAQYGWYKPEPRVVEFETEQVVRTESDRGDLFGIEHPSLEQFLGKRVKVTVTEVQE